MLLCKSGSKQAVCHCTHTYGVLLFTQVCREPAQMHCTSAEGKMNSPLFSAALQNRLKAGSVSLQSHLCRFALHTGVQGAGTNAVQLCSRQNAISTVQCCSAKHMKAAEVTGWASSNYDDWTMSVLTLEGPQPGILCSNPNLTLRSGCLC